MCIWTVEGEGSSNRNATRDESVEAGDESVESRDESIEDMEKHSNHVIMCIIHQKKCLLNANKNTIPFNQMQWESHLKHVAFFSSLISQHHSHHKLPMNFSDITGENLLLNTEKLYAHTWLIWYSWICDKFVKKLSPCTPVPVHYNYIESALTLLILLKFCNPLLSLLFFFSAHIFWRMYDIVWKKG